MRVLIVKTSSLGDVIHTLPALTDAGRAIPGIQFDWLVEENFAEIPSWHPLVDRVIPVALRRWRKSIFSKETRDQFRVFRKLLQSRHYDLVIDAQGLLKSALLARMAKGICCGLDGESARERAASWFYRHCFSVAKNQHAITRIRSLFSQALHYPMPVSVPNYGLDRAHFEYENKEDPYLVFLHGTTWETKHWPESSWLTLAKIAHQKGFKIKLPWGNSDEKARAERIAAACHGVEVLPKLNLKEMASVLANAKAAVAMDTGLGHLAAALNVPTVSIYGPTDPKRSGAMGQAQLHVSAVFPCAPCFQRRCTHPDRDQSSFPVYAPCFTSTLPVDVWKALESLL